MCQRCLYGRRLVKNDKEQIYKHTYRDLHLWERSRTRVMTNNVRTMCAHRHRPQSSVFPEKERTCLAGWHADTHIEHWQMLAWNGVGRTTSTIYFSCSFQLSEQRRGIIASKRQQRRRIVVDIRRQPSGIWLTSSSRVLITIPLNSIFCTSKHARHDGHTRTHL